MTVMPVPDLTDDWFPPPAREDPLGVVSRRLGKQLTRILGRRFTVRLRHRGCIETWDHERGLVDGWSWQTDEHELSASNKEKFTAIVDWLLKEVRQ